MALVEVPSRVLQLLADLRKHMQVLLLGGRSGCGGVMREVTEEG